MVFFRDGEAVPGCISTSSRSAAKAMHHTPAGTPPSLEFLSVFSLKHDLARSCFQIWPKIGDEGDKISREKTGFGNFGDKSKILDFFSRNF